MKKKQFFENFIAIMLFGVVGVFISFAIISTGMKELQLVREIFLIQILLFTTVWPIGKKDEQFLGSLFFVFLTIVVFQEPGIFSAN